MTRVLGFDPSTDQASLGIATAGSYPGLAGTTRTLVRLTGPPQTIVSPAGGAPASISVFPGLGSLGTPGLTFDMPGQSAAFTSVPLAHPLQLTGSATVRIRVSGAPVVTMFAKIYDVDQAGNATLPSQLVSPLRVTGAQRGRVVSVTLPGLDYNFAAGHRLRFVLTTTDFAYASPAGPAVYQVALAGRGVTMPGDPALTVVTGGVPWWVWAAPAAALVAAALILVSGRARGRGGFVPELADVPLEITGLTKRFRDGQLAVDDLSLRVERGQILGLLGPNGAGKTTTLRALMGLLHPQAGTITIFGRRVHPGSAALSRLGSFVEGPGFLPHLSGRANLDLYWRATGRPAGAAYLAGGTRGGRPRCGHRPQGADLLARDVPAARHRPGHARHARPAGARRADERPGPAADPGDARCPAPVRGRWPDGHPVQPPARGGGADLLPCGGHAPGPAAGRRPGRGHHRGCGGAAGRDTRARPCRGRTAGHGRDRWGGGASGRRAGPP